MRPTTLALLALAGACCACATYNRGTFAAASATILPVEMETVRERVEGSACSDILVQRLEAAVEDALSQSPGADALADVSFHFERLCIVARGTAVRIGGGERSAPAPPPGPAPQRGSAP